MVKLKSETVQRNVEQAFEDTQSDFFNFRDLIERLTLLYAKMDGGSVCILDGRWGAGKSTFCKAWISHLQKEGFPALYFDAFAADISAGPYEALSGAIIKRAYELKVSSEPSYRMFVAAAAKVGKSVAGSATNIAIRAASMGFVNQQDLEAAGDAGKALIDRLADGGEGAVKRVLEAQAQSADDIKSFKSALEELPALLRPKNCDYEIKPLVFIVDELDRCRPDFALGLVETLKHLFDVKGINFVISTHMPQLERSVAHRYGIGDFSGEYLEKFYDFTVNFSTGVGSEGRRGTRRFISYLMDELEVGDHLTRNDIARYLDNSVPVFQPSIRQIEKIFLNLVLVYSAKRQTEKYDDILVVYLSIFMIIRKDLYIKARSGNLKFQEVNEFLRSFDWDDENYLINIIKMFQYHLDPKIDQHSDEWRGYHSNYRLGRMEAIPYYCMNVIERFASKSGG